MPVPFSQGEKIYLRAIDPADAPAFERWMNDGEVNRYLLIGAFPLSLEDERDWIRDVRESKDLIVLSICLTDGDRLVGNVALGPVNWVDRCAAMGIVIGEKDCWENGIGTQAGRLLLEYAFETLNLHRVELDAFDFNERARALYRRLGFVEEGRQRQKSFQDGRYIDHYLMGILREEWEQAAGK